MRLFRPGFPAACLYPEALFRVKTIEKILYLTFDDGPDPASTKSLLDILRKLRVPAMFFCNGMAAEQNPDLLSQIRQDGHLIGNHGYSHYDGWRTNALIYVNDVNRASEFTSDKLLRPPFGRITFRQERLLKSYKLIFWDIMAYDFDISFGSTNSLRILKTKIRPGSIIVLHDTASSCAVKILSEFITLVLGEGYRFELLDSLHKYS
jgi:peptidoglycan/xylan/chitin deacetylase (PgdA/CDA1 family)